MNKENFFIGWNGSLSPAHKKRLWGFLIPIFVLIPALAFIIVLFTKPFNTARFEIGQLKEFSGIYYVEPFPVLVLDSNQVPKELSRNALLVGYGKNGAKTFISAIEKTKGALSGKKIKLQGTLIYGDNKTLIELTRKEKSLLAILDESVLENPMPAKSEVVLRGEILDPKCWFGVMKPGEGKVHKSCAIRCISGGIAPVLRVSTNHGNDYYVLKDVVGLDIHKEILSFVAEPVEIAGQRYVANGWNVLDIDCKKIKLIK